MSEGWTETTLGEVAEIVMGQSPPGDTYNEKGEGLPFIQGSAEFGERHPNPVKWCSKPKKVAEAGDLLVSVRAPVGDLNFANEQTAIGRGLAVVRGSRSAITGFVALAIQHALPELRSRSGGGMFDSTTKHGLSGLGVSVPPLAEQHRIVDLIAAVDESIAAADELEVSARIAREAVLAELLGSGGDDWVETTLGEVAEVVMGQSPPGHTYNITGEGLPFIQGSAEFGERHPTPVKWCSEPKKVADVGDLLISVRAPVGDVNFSKEEIAIGRGLAIVRGTESATIGFIALAIQHALPELRSRSGGGMFESITKQGLSGSNVSVPPPSEQRRIVETVSAFDDVVASASAFATSLRQSRTSLLADLLSSEHEIPESYDRLLEAS